VLLFLVWIARWWNSLLPRSCNPKNNRCRRLDFFFFCMKWLRTLGTNYESHLLHVLLFGLQLLVSKEFHHLAIQTKIEQHFGGFWNFEIHLSLLFLKFIKKWPARLGNDFWCELLDLPRQKGVTNSLKQGNAKVRLKMDMVESGQNIVDPVRGNFHSAEMGNW
jgi:hypothetical protein